MKQKNARKRRSVFLGFLNATSKFVSVIIIKTQKLSMNLLVISVKHCQELWTTTNSFQIQGLVSGETVLKN